MKFINQFAYVCLALTGLSNSARAADNPSPFCKDISGRIVSTLLGIGPTSLAPYDPAGRVLGKSTGDIKGATTVVIKSATQNPDQSTVSNTLDVFATGPGDLIWGDAVATLTPIAGRPSFKEVTILTIKGGTGRWIGATGTMQINGEGTFLNPALGQDPGNLVFDLAYTGRVCKTNFEDGWWQ